MKIRLNFLISISLNHHPIVTSFCIYSISNSFIHIYIAHSNKRIQLHNHCIVYSHKCINMKHILIVYSSLTGMALVCAIFIADKQWNIYLAGIKYS